MVRSRHLLALDVGERRIGVALADEAIGIAVPLETIPVDGNELTRIGQLVQEEQIDVLVVGYPRNQSGEPTQQTAYVEQFVQQLKPLQRDVFFQDESLTSVLAEQELQQTRRPYEKGDIDMIAARLILQDFLELHRG